MECILKAEDLSYSIEGKPILSGVSFEVLKGEILGIAGHSGGGKTTLARIIAGLLEPDSGCITPGRGISGNNKPHEIQILFQNNGELLNPFRKVNDVITEALRLRHKNRADIVREKVALLAALSIPALLLERKGFELSSGEQQRIALARILAVRPEILIVDEPFSAQDIKSVVNLREVFRRINKEFNVTIICISHSLRILGSFADNIIILYKGRIIEKASAGNLIRCPEHSYTKFLLGAENLELKSEDFNIPELF